MRATTTITTTILWLVDEKAFRGEVGMVGEEARTRRAETRMIDSEDLSNTCLLELSPVSKATSENLVAGSCCYGKQVEVSPQRLNENFPVVCSVVDLEKSETIVKVHRVRRPRQHLSKREAQDFQCLTRRAQTAMCRSSVWELSQSIWFESFKAVHLLYLSSEEAVTKLVLKLTAPPVFCATSFLFSMLERIKLP